MAGKPEFIGSCVGLVPTNAPALTDNRWREADFPVLIRTMPNWITVAVGTTIADHPPRTDPYGRVYAYGSYRG
jgi:hypothetical protein